MGNASSFIRLHGKRLKNRYNAQYRAIEFIGKENRPSAPRHPVPGAGETVNDASLIQELQKKDLKLDVYLKDVYIKSHDEVPQDSPLGRNIPGRPLPESRKPRTTQTFNEPEEVEKGWCTLSEISTFIASHEKDPMNNSSAAIAEKYNLDEKKVENTLKYFTIFNIYNVVEDTIPKDKEEDLIEEDLENMRRGEQLRIEQNKK